MHQTKYTLQLLVQKTVMILDISIAKEIIFIDSTIFMAKCKGTKLIINTRILSIFSRKRSNSYSSKDHPYIP